MLTMRFKHILLLSCIAVIYVYSSNLDYQDHVRDNQLYCEMIMDGAYPNWREIDCTT
jgi:hypothetical protein